MARPGPGLTGTPDSREAPVRHADAVPQPRSPSSGENRCARPSESLQRVVTDLLHWCDDTQRDIDAARARARTRHALELPDD